jgi:hypothetical protein
MGYPVPTLAMSIGRRLACPSADAPGTTPCRSREPEILPCRTEMTIAPSPGSPPHRYDGPPAAGSSDRRWLPQSCPIRAQACSGGGSPVTW